MRLSAVVVKGFRNLNTTVKFTGPLAVVVGENNAGKSNVIDALRAVLSPEAGPRSRFWLTANDFSQDVNGERLSDALEIEVQFVDLSSSERARMVTCLVPGNEGCEAKLRLTAKLSASERVDVNWFGGDSLRSDVELHAREAVRYVYLPPLRDADADLRPGRSNKLVDLVRAAAPAGSGDQQLIVDVATEANRALGDIPAIQNARSNVGERFDAITGNGALSQATNLEFDDPTFERVMASLRAKIGDKKALDLYRNGLGYNNLLYMSVLLAALEADLPPDGALLRVLLVEEPEAHLHPQLQDLLMGFLDRESGDGTHVVATTHSPIFASSAQVERITVLRRDSENTVHSATINDFGVDAADLNHLRRFLDATKSAMLFARSVVFVEGLSEQLLLPVIARRAGTPLDAKGVTIVNIDGVAFKPFMALFEPGRLEIPVAVLSDSDPGDDGRRCARAEKLLDMASANVNVWLSDKTLEHDLVLAGNSALVLKTLAKIKPLVARRLARAIEGKPAGEAADMILAKLEDRKGEFAQLLAEELEDESGDFHVPAHIADFLAWVRDDV